MKRVKANYARDLKRYNRWANRKVSRMLKKQGRRLEHLQKLDKL